MEGLHKRSKNKLSLYSYLLKFGSSLTQPYKTDF